MTTSCTGNGKQIRMFAISSARIKGSGCFGYYFHMKRYRSISQSTNILPGEAYILCRTVRSAFCFYLQRLPVEQTITWRDGDLKGSFTLDSALPALQALAPRQFIRFSTGTYSSTRLKHLLKHLYIWTIRCIDGAGELL